MREVIKSWIDLKTEGMTPQQVLDWATVAVDDYDEFKKKYGKELVKIFMEHDVDLEDAFIDAYWAVDGLYFAMGGKPTGRMSEEENVL